MSLSRNKKGIEWSTFIEMILIIVATGLIIGVFTTAAGRADEKTSENLCRGFNALRFGTQVNVGPVNFNLAPRACKTIDKKDVPSKDYINHVKGEKEGAKTEIRNLMARCWWMWLEGNQIDMFSTSTFSPDEKCFICYTFSVDKDIGPISYEDFSVSLNEPYYAVDGTDRCAPQGQGGFCRESCGGDFQTEVPSTKCNPQETTLVEVVGRREIEFFANDDSTFRRKCCVGKNECENKGGKCIDGPLGPYTAQYNKWKCSSNTCYITPEKSASYLDYIQGSKGVTGGAGKVLFGDDEGFKPNQKYAITFLSPGKEWNTATIAGTGTTGTLMYWTGGLIGSGIVTGGVSIATVAVASGLTAASYYFTSNTGTINDINYVMLSRYNTVENKCAVETGAGER
jgi:hypothetical protein